MTIRTATLPLVLLLAAGLLWAKEPWEGKSPGEWTREEAMAFLEDSPWAKEERVMHLTGRMLAVFQDPLVRTREYKVVYREGPNQPSRIFDRPPQRIEPERAEAIYAVRWDSAEIVQQGFARLRELSKFHAGMLAPPKELSDEHYVLTARVVKPPFSTLRDQLERARVLNDQGLPVEDKPARVADIFAMLEPDELKERAELRTSEKTTVRPERVVRHGVGASEGITFYFPRRQDGEATLPGGTEWIKFYFRGPQEDELKVKFKPEDMQRGSEPDL